MRHFVLKMKFFAATHRRHAAARFYIKCPIFIFLKWWVCGEKMMILGTPCPQTPGSDCSRCDNCYNEDSRWSHDRFTMESRWSHDGFTISGISHMPGFILKMIFY